MVKNIKLQNNKTCIPKAIIPIIIAFLYIAGAAFYNTLTIVAFAMMIFYIFSSDEEDVIALGFLLCTMASIMKYHGNTSLLNVYFAVSAVRLLYIRRWKLRLSSVYFLMIVLTISMISLALSSFGTVKNILTFITEMLFAILVLSSAKGYSCRRFVVAFSFGLILSSLTYYFADFLPGIHQLVMADTFKLSTGERVLRFSGLIGNPNHYTLAVSLAIAAHISYTLSGKGKIYDIVAIIILLYFGLYSLSMSFVFGLVITLIVAAIYLARKNPTKWIKYILIGIGTLLVVTYYIGPQYIGILKQRLAFDNAIDLNGYSNGRLNLMKLYLDYMGEHPYIYIIGNGLFNILDRSSHNFYIEMVYYCGVPLSFGLFISWIIVGKKYFYQVNKSILNWLILIVFLVRAFGINIVVSIVFPFYILLCTLFIGTNLTDK